MIKLVTSKINTPTLTAGQICIVTGEFPEENKIQINGKNYKYRSINFEQYIIPNETEVIILGKDKYYEEDAGQEKFLSKKGRIIQHYVTELEKDPVYQVNQGKTYKDYWFYCQDNVFPTALSELYEQVFGEPLLTKEPVIDGGSLIQDQRVEFCKKDYPYSSAASYLIVDRDGDHSHYYNRLCHGPVNSPMGAEHIAVVYNLQHDIKLSSSDNELFLMNFWEYIVNRSPWAYGFLDKNPKENMNIGLLVNIDIHPMEVRSVCMALRSGWESQYAKRWSEYVKEGFNEDFALLLCLATTSVNNFSGFSGSHFPFGGNVKSEKIAKFFALGHDAFPDSVKKLTYRECASSNVTADVLMESIKANGNTPLYKFFHSFGKSIPGKGMNGDTIVCNKEVLLEVQEAFQSLVNSYKV